MCNTALFVKKFSFQLDATPSLLSAWRPSSSPTLVWTLSSAQRAPDDGSAVASYPVQSGRD